MNRLFFECFYFALYEFGELLGLGQFYEVFGDKELGVEAGGCVFDHFRPAPVQRRMPMGGLSPGAIWVSR